MKFWRAEFGPKCAGEAFDKKYAYGVRYNYAKEGKRTDYTPYSCMKIIQTPVPKVTPLPQSCQKQAVHNFHTWHYACPRLERMHSKAVLCCCCHTARR